jgi:hypothetical protein
MLEGDEAKYKGEEGCEEAGYKGEEENYKVDEAGYKGEEEYYMSDEGGNKVGYSGEEGG